jgi:transposase
MGRTSRYTREFKLEAVRLVREGKTAAAVARELGISGELLRRWRRDAEAGGERAFPGHGRPKPENEELVALRREVKRLREDRDFLKKAAAYFAAQERRGSRR